MTLSSSSAGADAPDPRSDVTLDLLNRVKAGEPGALDLLIARYIPDLSRWATGRLSRWARHAVDTDDLVQETLIQVFQRLDTFEYRGEGALLGYLRQAVLNRIRNQVRWAGRRPRATDLESAQVEAADPSPVEAAIGAESIEIYEAALVRLRPDERDAIIARVELGLTYPDLARAIGKPSSDAARMFVSRALLRLAEEMRNGRRTPVRPGAEHR